MRRGDLNLLGRKSFLPEHTFSQRELEDSFIPFFFSFSLLVLGVLGVFFYLFYLTYAASLAYEGGAIKAPAGGGLG
jgi:hypothetical protein